mmetsp:Transcript_45710/g.95927  ORF Transcript_45710/g.95927 Transcript_45710/m.95927 type:complete len:299 (-) Transcript_45710:513-1409(-)
MEVRSLPIPSQKTTTMSQPENFLATKRKVMNYQLRPRIFTTFVPIGSRPRGARHARRNAMSLLVAPCRRTTRTTVGLMIPLIVPRIVRRVWRWNFMMQTTTMVAMELRLLGVPQTLVPAVTNPSWRLRSVLPNPIRGTCIRYVRRRRSTRPGDSICAKTRAVHHAVVILRRTVARSTLPRTRSGAACMKYRARALLRVGGGMVMPWLTVRGEVPLPLHKEKLSPIKSYAHATLPISTLPTSASKPANRAHVVTFPIPSRPSNNSLRNSMVLRTRPSKSILNPVRPNWDSVSNLALVNI